jgi:DNA-binding PadR family transcriptional regulator
MKSLKNMGDRPAAAPLAADDILEFHAGRLLLLLSTCGGTTGTINGLTKMAKLDFFVRYPDFFSAALAEGLRRKAVRTDAVEAAMVRHHYGPWDKRYYHILASLEARRLVTIVMTGRARRIALTALGKATVKKLLANEAFRDVVAHMRNVNAALGRKTGNELKTMIYDLFDEEVADQPLGQVISGVRT